MFHPPHVSLVLKFTTRRLTDSLALLQPPTTILRRQLTDVDSMSWKAYTKLARRYKADALCDWRDKARRAVINCKASIQWRRASIGKMRINRRIINKPGPASGRTEPGAALDSCDPWLSPWSADIVARAGHCHGQSDCNANSLLCNSTEHKECILKSRDAAGLPGRVSWLAS